MRIAIHMHTRQSSHQSHQVRGVYRISSHDHEARLDAADRLPNHLLLDVRVAELLLHGGQARVGVEQHTEDGQEQRQYGRPQFEPLRHVVAGAGVVEALLKTPSEL